MKHYMLDLETLGTKPGCKILSIGACEITDVLVPFQFYIEIKRDQQLLVEDFATLEWWEENKTAHTGDILNWDNPNAVGIKTSLESFSNWLAFASNGEEYCIWGNGSDFYAPIAAYAYTAYKTPLPWNFRNLRCYRTLKALAPTMVPPTYYGNKHNSLDDALNQSRHLLAVCRKLGIEL